MNNGEYWKKRFELLEQAAHRQGVQCYADIEKQYRQAQKTLEGQIAAWYQRFASNNGITLAEARRMLDAKELAELKWDIYDYIRYGEENAISGTWVKQLENASARFHISRLEALKLQTQQNVEVMFGNQLDSIDSTMRNVYKSGYYHTAYEIQKGVGVGWDFSTLDDRQISKVINKPWAVDGKNFSERIWGNRQKLVNELNNTLTQNIILGKDPQKAIDEIARKMNTSKTNAGRLVMTEEAFFSSAAQKDCFDELDVEQFEIVATLDSHTSDICRGMDGKHFPMSEWKVGVTAPPFHVHCRSTTVPYFGDKFDAVGERAARDEETGKTYYVPADTTYKDWKKAFVNGGDKSQFTPTSPMEKSNESGYTIRTKEEFENITNSIKSDITNYANNHSKWSGNINVHKDLIDGDAMGIKEWSCDIAVIASADDGVLWHEMLHSCSASYYPPNVYSEHQFIEEGTVEFLKQQICAERNIRNIGAYEDKVLILKIINDSFGYGTDLEFAKEIFNIPLPDRYQWLVDKVDESLRNANASFEDYNDVMFFLKALEGGENG
jgi:SPP1 gp7 family putative phage head morphogenesis protein